MSDPVQERLCFVAVEPVRRPGAGIADLATLAPRLVEVLAPSRPIAFLDLETTGLDPLSDRIVEVSAARIDPDGAYDGFESLVRPGPTIPEASTRIHGIDDRMVAEAPTFGEIAAPLRRLLGNSDLAGYNLARFDLPMLAAEFDRAGIGFEWRERDVVDVCVIFRRMERRDLDAAVRFYCDTEPAGRHTAAADMVATLAVFLGQLRRYPDLPREVAALDALWRPAAPSSD